jgi:hypothetical protein
MPQCHLWNDGGSTALALYKKFVKSLQKINHGFKLNPYDGWCVANKTAKGKQVTVCFHVDDCKLSHEPPEVIDDTIDLLRAEYESIFEDGLGAMKVQRGKVHKTTSTWECPWTSQTKGSASSLCMITPGDIP